MLKLLAELPQTQAIEAAQIGAESLNPMDSKRDSTILVLRVMISANLKPRWFGTIFCMLWMF